MKVLKQANLVRIVILAAMAVLVCPNAILAKPGLDNPSFETGDLSGWSVYIHPRWGSASAVLNHNSEWPYYMSYDPPPDRRVLLCAAEGRPTWILHHFITDV